jgi:CheY-like chemotaxis protein
VKTILFADDSKNIREYCRATLEKDGYRVTLASDGLDAIRAFMEATPDVVILDVSMPRATGLEALEQIRRLAPQVPAILFTAHERDFLEDRRTTLASACVKKGEDLSNLKLVIADMFKRVKPEECLGPTKLGRLSLPPNK